MNRMTSLMHDVSCVVILYLAPQQMSNFFNMFGINFDMKCSYDGSGYKLIRNDAMFIFGLFPNMIKNVCVCCNVVGGGCGYEHSRGNGCVCESYYSLFSSGLDNELVSVVIKNGNISDVNMLQFYRNLERVTFDGCGVLNIADLNKCLKLNTIKMCLREYGKFYYITRDDMCTFNACKGLKNLELFGVVGKTFLGSYRFSCKKLRSFKFTCDDFYRHECLFRIIGLTMIEKCSELRVLDMNNCCLKSVDGLVVYHNLVKVRLCGFRELVNVSGLGKCVNLKWLDLSKCVNLVDVSGLIGCRNLKYLNLSGTGCNIVDVRNMFSRYSGLKIVL